MCEDISVVWEWRWEEEKACMRVMCIPASLQLFKRSLCTL